MVTTHSETCGICHTSGACIHTADALRGEPTRCPKCNITARLSRPAEEDVGLMVPVFACEYHGEFFDKLGNWAFVDGSPYPEPPSEIPVCAKCGFAILPLEPGCVCEKEAPIEEVTREHRKAAVLAMYPRTTEEAPIWGWVETGEGDNPNCDRVARAIADAEACTAARVSSSIEETLSCDARGSPPSDLAEAKATVLAIAAELYDRDIDEPFVFDSDGLAADVARLKAQAIPDEQLLADLRDVGQWLREEGYVSIVAKFQRIEAHLKGER